MAQMVYSFSRLSLYEKCPYRFYLRYVLEKEEQVTEPLALGKAVHKAIESYMKGKEKEDALLDGWIEADCFPINQKDYRQLVDKAPVKQGDGLKSGVELEKHFKIPLSDSLSAPMLQGYIDQVNKVFGRYSFLDWKTNRKTYQPLDTWQLALYAWALSKIYEVKIVDGTLHFLRYFKNARQTMTFTHEEMEMARSWAEQTANEIERRLLIYEMQLEVPEEIFPAKPSGNCSHCSFAFECLTKNTNMIGVV